MGPERSILDYKDMKDSSRSKSPQSLHKVWQSGLRLGPFKSQLGTPRASRTVPGSVNWESQCCSDLQAPVLEVPRPTRCAGCFLELQGPRKMSRIYHDSALRNKAVQSARLPGTWDPAAHQG